MNSTSETQNRGRGQGILIVDRASGACSALGIYLRGVGFYTLEANTREDALSIIGREAPALIIIDPQLDSYDGFMVVSELRRLSNAPIIVTAANFDLIDKISVLEGGADDYIRKDCTPREILAHVRARLRRYNLERDSLGGATDSSWSEAAGGRKIDASNAFVFDNFIYPGLGYDLKTLQGEEISLSGRELSFLRLLAEDSQRHIPFDEIAVHIYRGQENVDRRISVMVSRLRSKLEPHTTTHPIIVCKPTVGYKLNAIVKSAA